VNPCAFLKKVSSFSEKKKGSEYLAVADTKK